MLKKEIGLTVMEIDVPNAKLHGGDVLFTGNVHINSMYKLNFQHKVLKSVIFYHLGREFFIGLSAWTNESGAMAVAAAFPEFPCTPVKVFTSILNLIFHFIEHYSYIAF